MKNSTLCYIAHEEKILLMHRVKKVNDENRDKWIGIGGKLEEGESPIDCVLREAKEETALTLTSYAYRGLVTFVSDRYETEQMHLFTADAFEGSLTEDCDEGVLEWVTPETLASLPAWEGDRIFLRLLRENVPFFSLKLVYAGDCLTQAVLNGKEIPAHEE